MPAILALLSDDEITLMLRTTVATIIAAHGTYDRLRAEKERRRAEKQENEDRLGRALLGKRAYDRMCADVDREMERRGIRPKR